MWGDGCVNRHMQGPRWWCRVTANARAVGAEGPIYPCRGQNDHDEFLEEVAFHPVFFFLQQIFTEHLLWQVWFQVLGKQQRTAPSLVVLEELDHKVFKLIVDSDEHSEVNKQAVK